MIFFVKNQLKISNKVKSKIDKEINEEVQLAFEKDAINLNNDWQKVDKDFEKAFKKVIENYNCNSCRKCISAEEQMYRFIVCSTCGNKRCPKATDCVLECTNSNEPGQSGSVY